MPIWCQCSSISGHLCTSTLVNTEHCFLTSSRNRWPWNHLGVMACRLTCKAVSEQIQAKRWRTGGAFDSIFAPSARSSKYVRSTGKVRSLTRSLTRTRTKAVYARMRDVKTQPGIRTKSVIHVEFQLRKIYGIDSSPGWKSNPLPPLLHILASSVRLPALFDLR